MTDMVQPGSLLDIRDQKRLNEPTPLYINDLAKSGDKRSCTFSDGQQTMAGSVASTKFSSSVDAGEIENGGVVQICEYICNHDQSNYFLMVFELDIVSKSAPAAATGQALSVKIEPGTGLQEHGSLTRAQSVATPRHAKENIVPIKTPATKVAKFTPGPTPPSTGRKGAQPIQALNPYNNNWTVKARVVSKTPIRTLKRDSNDPLQLFSIILVDEQGTEIEGTFWRNAADHFHDRLAEGKVYFFSRGRVKPANKTFVSTRNDYSIDFTSDTQIEEANDDDPSKMQAKVKYSRFDGLEYFLGKKVLADVIGVVKEVQPLGSVKRKSDGVDLPRRDITLVDQTGKMVKLTIWGAMAENEGAQVEAVKDSHPVLSVTNVRVGDYDGLSLSSVSRSVALINPDVPETDDLQVWWGNEGIGMTFAHVADGLQTARRSREGYSSERAFLASIVKEREDLPPPDAKPEFASVKACVMKIEPEQSPFFYPADPATGKKVVQSGDGWRTAGDDKPCASMQRRYFVRINIGDFTGSCDIHLSNDQAEKLLGHKADELYDIRESGDVLFQSILLSAQFAEWTFLLKSNTSDFRGELRQRLQGAGRFQPVDFVAESKQILSKLPDMMAGAGIQRKLI